MTKDMPYDMVTGRDLQCELHLNINFSEGINKCGQDDPFDDHCTPMKVRSDKPVAGIRNKCKEEKETFEGCHIKEVSQRVTKY